MPSSQRTPGAAPQVGQRTASTCLGVISFMVEKDSAGSRRGLFNLDHIEPLKKVATLRWTTSCRVAAIYFFNVRHALGEILYGAAFPSMSF